MPKEIEIIPPQRTQIAKPAEIKSNVPTLYSGGRVQAMLDTGRWNAQSRALDSLARVNASEANLRAQQTALVEQDTRFREALLRHQELPEKWGHELALRRAHRANELRQAQHGYEMQEMRRRREYTLAEADYTHAKATLTHARTVLCDAEQQLNAQRKHGELNYELAHAKKNLELLDVQLSAEERRALMHKQLREIEGDLGESDEERFERELAEDIDAVIRKPTRKP